MEYAENKKSGHEPLFLYKFIYFFLLCYDSYLFLDNL